LNEVCKEKINTINLLINDELNDLEKKAIETHFFSCPACSNYYKDLLFIKNNLSTIKLSLPETFSQNTMKKIKYNKENKIKKINFNKAFKYSASVLAACFVVIIGLTVYHNSSLTSTRAGKSVDLAENSIYEESTINSNESNFRQDSTVDNKVMAVVPKQIACDDISYDYLYKSISLTTNELADIIIENFEITDFNVLDDCVIFNTDEKYINKIVEKLKLEVVEKNESDSDNTVIKVKILGALEKK